MNKKILFLALIGICISGTLFGCDKTPPRSEIIQNIDSMDASQSGNSKDMNISDLNFGGIALPKTYVKVGSISNNDLSLDSPSDSDDDEKVDDSQIETADTDLIEMSLSETSPSETLPSETVPSETLPSETVPSETVPSETSPSETSLSDTSLSKSTDVTTTRHSQVMLTAPTKQITTESLPIPLIASLSTTTASPSTVRFAQNEIHPSIAAKITQTVDAQISSTPREVESVKNESSSSQPKHDYPFQSLRTGLPQAATGVKTVALTFDDGPNSQTIHQLLDLLERYDIDATFCLLGDRALGQDEALRRMVDEGHLLVNHSTSHKDLLTLDDKELVEEITKTDQIVGAATGVKPALIRPPYGSYDNRVTSVINRPVLNWSLDTRDWDSLDSDEIFSVVSEKVKDGDVILFHDIYPSTVEAVEHIIPDLISKGFVIVRADELITADGNPVQNRKVYRHKPQ